MAFPFEQDILLENDRVLLRPLRLEDASGLLLQSNGDDKLLQYSPAQIHTAEYLDEYIRTAITGREKKKRYPFAIIDKQSGNLAGSTSYMTIVDREKRLEIGSTWIGRGFQGTGLNRNMKFLMLQYAFDTLGYERVEFMTDERNAQSRRAMEKIGCKFEGVLRNHLYLSPSYRRNSAVYSIIRDEWPLISQSLERAKRQDLIP
jgi:N-acetyltransferase